MRLFLPLCLSSAPRCLRDRLRRFLHTAQVPQAVCDDLILAAHEVLCNALMHSGQTEGRVEVVARVSGGEVRVDVRDWGPGFASIPSVPPAVNLLEPRGRGLLLARLLTDDMRIHHPDDGGVRICLVKFLPARCAGSLADSVERA